ncbi:Hypothetical protein PBC10988_30190 [Planctomycetales bacterium 10988]|nr:Hypothetical protein PBC10988_30190 [Planctomycetales bacterium 10988]
MKKHIVPLREGTHESRPKIREFSPETPPHSLQLTQRTDLPPVAESKMANKSGLSPFDLGLHGRATLPGTPDAAASAKASSAESGPSVASQTPAALPKSNDRISSLLGTSVPPEAALGHQFGNYELLQIIARGGMGVVYKARQINLNRIVAIKMILAGKLASEDEVQRFVSEAKAAAKLKHENIVTIHDVGQYDGHHYFSMDYVEGTSLEAWMRRHPLACDQAVRIIEKIARAIHHAHQNGVLHRDLKPSNVLVDPHGQPRITDFGVAKILDSDATLTRSGAILGTPHYMPPEQADRRKHDPSPMSDVYSLGAILYEMLTGRPPIQEGGTVDVLLQILKHDPIAPSLLNPKVARDLETICLKCLQKEPRKRYLTAEDLAEDLKRFRLGMPIKGRPVPCWERAWKWIKGNRASTAIAGVIALSLTGVAGLEVHYRQELQGKNEELQDSLVLEASQREALQKQKEVSERRRIEADQQRKQAETQQREAERQRQLALEQRQAADLQRQIAQYRELMARRNLYAVHIHLIQQAWEEADLELAEELLEESRPKAGEEDLRGFEWHYYWQLCHSDQATYTGHRLAIGGVDHSPDGKYLASASYDGTVRLWSSECEGEYTVLDGHDRGATSVQFRPDGKALAVGCNDGSVKIWNVDKRQVIFSFQAHHDSVYSVAYSPNGKFFATAGADRIVRVWNASTHEEIYAFSGHRDAVTAVAFSPDSRTLASASADRTARLWDLFGGTERAVLTGHKLDVQTLAFDPNGKHLATGSQDGTIRLWNYDEGKNCFAVHGDEQAVNAIAYSPDGKFLAIATASHTLRLLETESWQEVTTLRGHLQPLWAVDFSADGSSIATGSLDRTVKQWSTDQRQPCCPLLDIPREIACITFSPKGNLLVLGGGDPFSTTSEGYVLLSSVNRSKYGKQNIETLRVPSGPVQSVAVSADGRLLATGTGSPYDPDFRGVVQIWDLATQELLQTLPAGNGSIQALVFADNGNSLYYTDGSPEVISWDVQKKCLLAPLAGHVAGVQQLAVSRSGQWLASSALDETIRIWNLEDRSSVQTIPGYFGSLPIAFSPNHQLLAMSRAVRDESFTNLGREKQEEIYRFGDQVSYSPVADISLFNWQLKEEQIRLKGHARRVSCFAFSPDGKRLATGSQDRTLRIWDLASGHLLTTITGLNGMLTQLKFSPDGQVLASLTSDGQVRIWNGANNGVPSVLQGPTTVTSAFLDHPLVKNPQ